MGRQANLRQKLVGKKRYIKARFCYHIRRSSIDRSSVAG